MLPLALPVKFHIVAKEMQPSMCQPSSGPFVATAFFLDGIGSPEITSAANTNKPPIARRVTKASPPSVHANKAAKTGSKANIRETRKGERIFWARI